MSDTKAKALQRLIEAVAGVTQIALDEFGRKSQSTKDTLQARLASRTDTLRANILLDPLKVEIEAVCLETGDSINLITIEPSPSGNVHNLRN